MFEGGLTVFGTHDLQLLDKIRARAHSPYEVHMLYGIKSADQRSLAASGVAVRPANVWFVIRNLW